MCQKEVIVYCSQWVPGVMVVVVKVIMKIMTAAH